MCLLLNPAYGRQRLWETEACVCLSSRIVPGQSGLGRGSCLKKTKRGVYGEWQGILGDLFPFISLTVSALCGGGM